MVVVNNACHNVKIMDKQNISELVVSKKGQTYGVNTKFSRVLPDSSIYFGFPIY